MTSKNGPARDDPRLPGALCDADYSYDTDRSLFITISRGYKGRDTEIWLLWSSHFSLYWTDLCSIEVWNPDRVGTE